MHVLVEATPVLRVDESRDVVTLDQLDCKQAPRDFDIISRPPSFLACTISGALTEYAASHASLQQICTVACIALLHCSRLGLIGFFWKLMEII